MVLSDTTAQYTCVTAVYTTYSLKLITTDFYEI